MRVLLRTAIAAAVVAAGIVPAATPAHGQTAGGAGAEGVERRERIERAIELDPTESDDGIDLLGEAVLDYGAWLRVSFLGFDIADGRRIERQDYDLRLWAQAVVFDAHTLYVRGQFRYTVFAHDDGIDNEERDIRGPRIDLAFYQLDLGELVDPSSDRPWEVRLRGGRLYHRVGSGLALNNVLDGGIAELGVGPVSLAGFGLFTTDIDRDIDPSRAEADESDRFFTGGTAAVRLPAATGSRLFAFGVAQYDENREEIEVVGQDFDFDSIYVGGGLSGRVLGLDYLLEYTHMTGRRFASLRDDDREDIDAHAVVASVDKTWAGALLRPTLGFAYYYGSGDDDRIRVPDSILGNAAESSDRTFTAFGYVPLGLALNPLLANLHIASVRGEVSIPFDWTGDDGIGALNLGVHGFGYWKAEEEGGISDPFAVNDEREVGWALDVFLSWPVLSDVTVTGRLGVFFPDHAYDDTEDRWFFGTSIVLQL